MHFIYKWLKKCRYPHHTASFAALSGWAASSAVNEKPPSSSSSSSSSGARISEPEPGSSVRVQDSPNIGLHSTPSSVAPSSPERQRRWTISLCLITIEPAQWWRSFLSCLSRVHLGQNDHLLHHHYVKSEPKNCVRNTPAGTVSLCSLNVGSPNSSLQKRAFPQLFLCLSRACLGKNIAAFVYKWRKKHISVPILGDSPLALRHRQVTSGRINPEVAEDREGVAVPAQ